MIRLALSILMWVLALPVFCLKALWRVVVLRHFWSMAYRPNILCATCGETISLVGIWECRCGYTYRGHLLRHCPVCDSLPRMVRCFSCGTTATLPQP